MNFSQFHLADFIFKHIKGELSEQETVLLQEWIDASEEHRTLFEALCDKESYNTKTELYKRFNKLKRYTSINNHIHRRKRLAFLSSISAAAIVLFAVIIIFFLRNNDSEQSAKTEITVLNSSMITPGKASAILETASGEKVDLSAQNISVVPQKGAKINRNGNTLEYEKTENSNVGENVEEVFNTLSVPRGGEYKLSLSDGTKVWLNAESSIRYPVSFLNSERKVYVSGEVYFEVAHDEKRPFIVGTESLTVKVLGTDFNLRAYKDESFVQATLVKGAVSVGTENQMQTITPSEQYMHEKETGKNVVRKVDVSLYTSWKEGTFQFSSQPLEQILNNISRWYDVEFRYANEAAKFYIFSGRLRKYDNADGLLRIFENTGNIVFEKQGNVVYVKIGE